MASKKNLSAKELEHQKAKREETRKRAADIAVESVVKKVTDVSLQVNKSFAELTTAFQEQIAELSVLREAVQIEQEELDRLKEATGVVRNIDELEAIYQNRKREVDELLSRAETEHQQKLHDLEQERNRERANADYAWSVEVRNRRDTLDTEIASRRKTEEEAREAREKVLKAREDELMKHQTELEDLRNQVKELPDKIRKEVEREKAIELNSAKKELHHQMEILKSQMENAQKMADIRAKSQDEVITRLTQANSELQKALDSANSKVQALGEKALESASDKNALQALQNMGASRDNGQRSSKA